MYLKWLFQNNAGLFYVWSTSKYKFGTISSPNFDGQILDNIVAFLDFMALKVKPKVSSKFITLTSRLSLCRWKNYENSTFFPIWSLVWPSKMSLAFLIFFLRSLMPKKSSGMQKSYFWTGYHHQTLTNQVCHSIPLCQKRNEVAIKLVFILLQFHDKCSLVLFLENKPCQLDL